jgi:hypothetical protein
MVELQTKINQSRVLPRGKILDREGHWIQYIQRSKGGRVFPPGARTWLKSNLKLSLISDLDDQWVFTVLGAKG